MTRDIQRRRGATAVRLGVVAGVILAALAGAGCSGETASPPQAGRRSEPLDSTARPRFETPTVNSAIEYDGRLLSLNDSGVRGTATVRVDGLVIRVTSAVRGLDPSRRYRMTLHGFPDRRLPVLPPFRETVTARELDESVGPALVELAALRVERADGSMRETTSLRIERSALPLDVRAIVISEVLAEGALSPAAVCLLKPAELGDGGSGGPGTGGGGPGTGGGGPGSPGGGGGAGQNGGGTAPEGMTPGDGQGGGMTPGDDRGAGDSGGTAP